MVSPHPLVKKIKRFPLVERECSDIAEGVGDGRRPPFLSNQPDVLLKGLPLRSIQGRKGFGFEKDGRQNKPHRNGIPWGNPGLSPLRPFL
jgi:hypothetical protein